MSNHYVRLNGQTIKLDESDWLYLRSLGDRSLNCKTTMHDDCALARQEGRYRDCHCGCHLVDQT